MNLNNLTVSQRKAVKETGNNILVSAGAGSGKTGVLKERVIYKLKHGVHIDELIILTFTEAAAYEMKERIIKAINEDYSLKEELQRIDHAVISTFDAFCLKIVKQYHYLLDLPSNIKIGDKIQFMAMEKELLKDTIKDYYLKDDSIFNELVVHLFQKGDDLIYEAVNNLANKLKKEPNSLEILNNYETTFFSKEILEESFNEFKEILHYKVIKAKQIFEQLKTELAGYSDKTELYLSELESYLNACDTTNYDKLVNTVLTGKFPRKNSKNDDYLKSILDLYHDPIKNLINDSQKDSIKKIINNYELFSKESAVNNVLKTKTIILKIVEITREYLIRLANKKRELNLYLFQDIMDLATKLLEEHDDISNRYKKHINEIMIDEYQDTNDLQVHFVSLISNNNLFMVGDIKQSIYGFRDANPKHFLKKYLDYSKNNGGVLIDLRQNFRSRSQVLEDINHIFKEVMDHEIGGINYQAGQSLIPGQDKYNKHKKDNQNYGIDVIKYDSLELKEKLNFTDYVDTESTLLAKDIRNKIDTKYQIYDLDKKCFRGATYSDFAILVDRKNDFHRLAKTLSKYSIPVNLYSDEPFIGSNEMLFLTNYINFINCFIDEAYLKNNFTRLFYGVARSFVFKIQDQKIINFILSHEIQSISDLTKLETSNVFNKLYEITSYLSKLVKTAPVSIVVKEIYQKLDIYRMISYLDNPRKKEEKLDYFASLVNAFDHFTFSDLINYLENIESNQDWDIEYSENNHVEEAVKLMTMHKSKGLQFPIVYLPFLNKGFNFHENKDFFIYDKKYGFICKTFDDGFLPTYLRYISLYNSKKEYISERIRLFYVANTRAMENIVIILDESKIEENYDKLVGKYIDKDIRLKYNKYTDLLASTKIRNYTYKNKPVEEIKYSHEMIESLSDIHLEKRSFNFETELIEDKRYSKISDNLLEDKDLGAINFGNHVHKLLENIDFNHLDNSLNNLPNKIKESYMKLLESELFDFTKKLSIYQEYEFYDNNTLGIIDLLLVYQDKVYILDYKLKNISDEAYKKQLLGYSAYVSKITNLPVYCYLYSILDKELKEIK
ncbi:UvrD-helicase domain-containing protein [Candidatus Izemoplasma sp. B36]|uniref:UvrD-helicase domain-containing protein n=1 Tax=Candidatus Izemoplasma sp. B36 TaxID=3242468 RepID=UPI003556B646